MSLEEILSEIQLRTKIPKEEILNKINKKYEELSGLVTIEGAAYIIAGDLGLDLSVEKKRRLQIKNIFPGMKNINIIGRVFKISPINEFSRQDGTKGKVCNIFIGDETGFFRLPLWNDQVKIVDEKLIQLGDVVQITNGVARENIFGDLEISLGRFGNIRVVEDLKEFPDSEQLYNKYFNLPNKRTLIKDVREGYYLITGTIVYLFKGKFIFDICPLCGSKVLDKKCTIHSSIEPARALIISGIVDDGTADLRFVLFRDVAEKFLGLKAEEIFNLEEDRRYDIIKSKLLGREVEVLGKVKKSSISEKLEIIVTEIKDLNLSEEIMKLIGILEKNLGG